MNKAKKWWRESWRWRNQRLGVPRTYAVIAATGEEHTAVAIPPRACEMRLGDDSLGIWYSTMILFVSQWLCGSVTKRDVWLARQRRHTRTHRVKIEKIHYQQLMHVQQKRKHGKEEHVQW